MKNQRAEKTVAQEKRLATRVQKQFECTQERGSSVQCSSTGVSIMTDTPTEMSDQRRKMPFNLFIGKEDVIENVPFPCSPPRRKRPISPSGASCSGTQRILHLRAKPIMAKLKKSVQGGCRTIKSKQTPMAAERRIIKPMRTPMAADSDICRRFDNALQLYMPVRLAKG